MTLSLGVNALQNAFNRKSWPLRHSHLPLFTKIVGPGSRGRSRIGPSPTRFVKDRAIDPERGDEYRDADSA